MNIPLIFELDPKEKEWWGDYISKERNKIVKSPEIYVNNAFKKCDFKKSDISKSPENVIKSIRSSSWDEYISAESSFHVSAISSLVKKRAMPKEILQKLIKTNLDFPITNDKNELFEKLTLIIGDYAGRIMPYLYQLSLSTTNSRRSRAGSTFEKIIERMVEMMGYPYANQSILGDKFYKSEGLGKMVDIIIPGAEEYSKNRAKCVLVTMKTTLRERWQEVVEEVNRTNIPNIYLLTIDEGLNSNTADNLKPYNIQIVLYDSVKEQTFKNFDNVKGYKEFFNREIKHYVEYWSK
jgi:hypothetical protein